MNFPLAYLITVRCYGTWLHGDDRLSVDRHGLNICGKRRRPANPRLEKLMLQNMQGQSVILRDRTLPHGRVSASPTSAVPAAATLFHFRNTSARLTTAWTV